MILGKKINSELSYVKKTKIERGHEVVLLEITFSEEWLSMPFSECPFLYSGMFCSRCPNWNSIYIRSWADLYEVEKILLLLEHTEFKANVVICAFTG